MSRPKYPDGVAYIDGRYVPMAEATIPVLDWGFLRSDATYDVVHVWRGRFFRLDDHLDRFERSVDRLRLALPFGRDGVAEVLSECVRRAGFDDAYVEMICTRGVSPTFSRDPRDAVNRFIAFAIPFGWILRPEDRDRGLHIAISRVRRIPPESVDPTIKNYHWLDLIAGLFDAYVKCGPEQSAFLQVIAAPADGSYLVEAQFLIATDADWLAVERAINTFTANVAGG